MNVKLETSVQEVSGISISLDIWNNRIFLGYS